MAYSLVINRGGGRHNRPFKQPKVVRSEASNGISEIINLRYWSQEEKKKRVGQIGKQQRGWRGEEASIDTLK